MASDRMATLATEFHVKRGGEGYAEYTVVDRKTGSRLYISHPSAGWVVFRGRNSSDPLPTKRRAVEVAKSLLLSERGEA